MPVPTYPYNQGYNFMPERADIAGNIDSGVDLYLAIQQAKQRKAQFKAQMDYREQQLEATRQRNEALADFHSRENEDQIKRLDEATRHHAELEANNDKLTAIKQQLADAVEARDKAKNDRERDKWNDTVAMQAKKLDEQTREANQKFDVGKMGLDSKEDIAGMRDDTANRGLDLRQKQLNDSLTLGTAKNAIAADTAQMHNDTMGYGQIFTALQRQNMADQASGKPGKSANDLGNDAMDMWESIKAKRQRASLMPQATAPSAVAPSPAAGSPVQTPSPASPIRPIGQKVTTGKGTFQWGGPDKGWLPVQAGQPANPTTLDQLPAGVP